jgi:hypothetical protein
MATNTIAGANLAAIAEMTIPHLMSELVPLNAFTRDFSPDIAQKGASVTTRYATQPSAVDLSSGYTSQDTTMTSLTVTLNTFYGFVYGFNDVERSKSAVNLLDIFVAPAVQAIGVKVFGDLWNLVNDTNYPAATATELTVTAANFDRDDVADLAGQLTTNKVPKLGRSLILHPTHYTALAKDLNAADSSGQVTTIGEHRIPRLHGFDVYESPECDGNSVNVAGLACHRNNILMAARGVDFPSEASAAGVRVENVVVPGLGLPVQFRRWYDPNAGELKVSVGVLYGVLFGLPNAGMKIVTS